MKVFLKAIVDYSSWFYILGIFGILLCLRAALLARRERGRAIYTLEKEAATSKEFQVLTIGIAIGAAMGVVLFLSAAVAPQVTFVEANVQDETPAALVLPTVTPTRPQTTPTFTPTPTRIRPTPLPYVTPTFVAQVTVALPTPTLPPPMCPNPLARFTAPYQAAVVSGSVQVMGTANLENLDYYKVEFAAADNPGQWGLITDLHHNPVANGLLDVWDTTVFPNGSYRLRLIVVDNTGNYPEPCEVSVVVSN